MHGSNKVQEMCRHFKKEHAEYEAELQALKVRRHMLWREIQWAGVNAVATCSAQMKHLAVARDLFL